MATFKLNEPITTRDSRIAVDAGLPPGRYQFALTVVDAAGNLSRPSLHTVQILPTGRINIEIDRPNRDRPIINEPIIDRPIAYRLRRLLDRNRDRNS